MSVVAYKLSIALCWHWLSVQIVEVGAPVAAPEDKEMAAHEVGLGEPNRNGNKKESIAIHPKRGTTRE